MSKFFSAVICQKNPQTNIVKDKGMLKTCKHRVRVNRGYVKAWLLNTNLLKKYHMQTKETKQGVQRKENSNQGNQK